MILLDDYDQDNGIKTIVHHLGDKMVYEKSYDAEPFLKHAAEMRALNAGKRWGEGMAVGIIPPAELGTMMRQDGRVDPSRLKTFFKENPAFLYFERYIQ